MSKSNAFETELLGKLFYANEFSWAANSHLYVALHTADPGEIGTQASSECAYTSYARVAVVRTSSGWTVSGNQVINAAAIPFPKCTGGNETATHFSLGTVSSGATLLLYSGALTSSLTISNGIQPVFDPGVLTLTED